jgi:hypothetical protein
MSAMPAVDAKVVATFERFAARECGDEPLYAAMCRIAIAEPAVLSLMDAAPKEQRRPNLLLAAVQYLLLRGVKHALGDYYPSVGGQREADAELHARFVDFCLAQRSALTELIATRTTQTNEVGRCAVLWPVLQLVAQRRGFERIALLDFGCSAGLNLGVDRYRYDYGRMHLSPGGRDAAVAVTCRLVGEASPSSSLGQLPRIDSRLGLDTEPIDASDEASARWLEACVWPHDEPRRKRLHAALGIARENRWPLRRHRDCSAAVEPWLRSIEPGVLPVMVNSWVLMYFEREARAAHIARMRALVQQYGMAWVSAEAPEILIDPKLKPPEVDPPQFDGNAAAPWTVTMPGEGAPVSRYVAISHPHGKWMQWLG